MRLLLILILTLCLIVQTVTPSKILFLLPVASKSHVNVFEPLVRALGQRGHEVVSFTPATSKKMPSTVREIVVPKATLDDIFKQLPDPYQMRMSGSKFKQMMNFSMDFITDTCTTVLRSRELKSVMETESFDLIIIDILWNECMLGVVSLLDAPSIYLSTLAVPSQVVSSLGQRLPPSFVPHPFLELSDRMTFMQRVVNVMFERLFDWLIFYRWHPKFEAIIKSTMGIEVDLTQLESNVSMVFVNSHFTLTHPRPYLPSVVDVGGMHISPDQPLPKDLEEFISGAEHGCILFSMGSIAKGRNMPDHIRQMFVNVFARLKQRVLWKWEDDAIPNLSKNVKLGKWLPQQAILGHNNTKLFISHGGLLSTQEAVYYGVPILGMPLFADQDLNIKQAKGAGFALDLQIVSLTEAMLEETLNEMLTSPKYTEKVKELSSVWRDQPIKPLDAAVYWSEYVIRHKGASQLKSGAADLNFVQYHCLDVVVFVASIVLVLVSIACLCVKKSIKLVWNKVCPGAKSNVLKKKKKS